MPNTVSTSYAASNLITASPQVTACKCSLLVQMTRGSDVCSAQIPACGRDPRTAAARGVRMPDEAGNLKVPAHYRGFAHRPRESLRGRLDGRSLTRPPAACG